MKQSVEISIDRNGHQSIIIDSDSSSSTVDQLVAIVIDCNGFIFISICRQGLKIGTRCSRQQYVTANQGQYLPRD